MSQGKWDTSVIIWTPNQSTGHPLPVESADQVGPLLGAPLLSFGL